jgi:hypothetical protein
MKYRTKVRELEAIRFDGTNVEAIKTLTGHQFEFMETLQNVKYLLYDDGLVNLGDWVGVEDGKIKILSAAELENDYTPDRKGAIDGNDLHKRTDEEHD